MPLHGDWQTNNLFFARRPISGMIDFHQADFGPRLLDLAIAVERNCFFWNRISDGELTTRTTSTTRAAADRAYHAARRFGGRTGALTDVLAACQFEYGISFLDYYWGVEPDREKADWAWHTFVLGHARWWQSPPGAAARAELEQIVAELD